MKGKKIISVTKVAPVTVPKVKQIVHSILDSQEEEKSKDYDELGTGVDTTGIVRCVTIISQGTGVDQRIGDEIKLKSLDANIQLALSNAVGYDAYNNFRFIWFLWFDVATPIVASILQDPSSPMTSQIVLDYSTEGTLRILSDRTYYLNYGFKNTENIRIHKKMKNRIVYQTGSTSAGVGMLYFAIFSDSNAVPNPSFYIQSRIHYTDS